jgi:predicted DNA-binding transcriptional regulator YafY
VNDSKIRLIRLTQRLLQGRPVDTRYIRDNYPVSHATAKRDMLALEMTLACKRDRNVISI